MSAAIEGSSKVPRSSYLNEIFALRFRNKGLQLGSGEGIHESCFRHNKKQHLGAGQDGQFVCLGR